ncbi:TraG family conjugative transposon ATPase, partial [Komagataeibacter oboediens]|uniref:TraG/VirB4 family ATPase n=1 Tax=Komagataeibacter oboediens TaxID=65958 RepID=UPI0020B68F8F
NNSSLYGSSERIFPNLIQYRKYLRDVFSKKLKDFEAKKFEVEELVLLLEPYTEGELSYLLNATENVDIVNDKLIAFDMESASKKDYFPLVVIITLQMVVDKIKKRQGVKKELIIDEALDFLQDEKFGDFIAYLYRTFRKKEGAITIA